MKIKRFAKIKVAFWVLLAIIKVYAAEEEIATDEGSAVSTTQAPLASPGEEDDYHKILQSLMLVPQPRPPQETDDDAESFTLLNAQIQKAMGFIYNQGMKAKEYISDNEYEGKTGVSYVLSDLVKSLTEAPDTPESDATAANDYIRLLESLSSKPGLVEKHNEETQEPGSTSRPSSVDAYQLVVDETDDFRRAVENLIIKIPQCITNADIKSLAHEYIGRLSAELGRLEDSANAQLVPSLRSYVKRIDDLLLVAENLTADDLKQLLYSVHNKLNEELAKSITKENAEAFKGKLQELSESLWTFQSALNSKLPVNAPLKTAFNDLLEVLRQKLAKTDVLSQLPSSQLEVLKSQLAKQLDREFTAVDYDKYARNIQYAAPKLQEAVYDKLKESFSEANIQALVHGLITSAKMDLDSLKDPSKASEFIWDVDDLDRVADRLVTQIKLLHDRDGRIQFKFAAKDANDIMTKAKDLLERYYKPESASASGDGNAVFESLVNQAKLIEPLESEVGEIIASEEFTSKLKEYVRSYLSLLKTTAKKLGAYDWATQTELYKAVLGSLHLDKSVPQRLLSAQVAAELSRRRYLSREDRRVLDFGKSILAKWAVLHADHGQSFGGYIQAIRRNLEKKAGREAGLRHARERPLQYESLDTSDYAARAGLVNSMEQSLHRLVRASGGQLRERCYDLSVGLRPLVNHVLQARSVNPRAFDQADVRKHLLALENLTDLLQEKDQEGAALEAEVSSLLAKE